MCLILLLIIHTMDKIAHYQEVIIQFIHRYQVEMDGNSPKNPVKRRVLIDKENNSFQLLSIGWR
ncbi:MAG: element excision factor XisI family protein, partial [Bacteroidales bacterium]